MKNSMPSIPEESNIRRRDFIRTYGEEEARLQSYEENKWMNQHLDEWLHAVSNVDDLEISQPNTNEEPQHPFAPRASISNESTVAISDDEDV
jgi:hypothetical protein